MGSPAPASGHQGFCPQQSDLGQISSALNNTHIDWGTWKKNKEKMIVNTMQTYSDHHIRGICQTTTPVIAQLAAKKDKGVSPLKTLQNPVSVFTLW